MTEEQQTLEQVEKEIIDVDGKLRVLFFKIGALGDVIMTTPLLRQFKKNFPDAKLDYLVADYCKGALEGNTNIDEIITFNQDIFLKKQVSNWLKLVKQIRARKYDIIFVLDKHKAFNITAKLFGVTKRIGFNRSGEGLFLSKKVKFDGRQHEIHSFLDLLKSIKLQTNYEDVQTDLFLSKEEFEYGGNIWKEKNFANKKVICIAPGGANNPGQVGYQKVWPKERYLALAKKLLEKHYDLILVGDKNDIPTTKFIMDGLTDEEKSRAFDFAGNTNIKQTASLMRKCEYVICNDTGPMHIAGSVNKKVISIFGPTRAKRFAPLNKESKSIQSNISCFDCYDIYGNFEKCGHKDVIKNIKVDDVLEHIK